MGRRLLVLVALAALFAAPGEAQVAARVLQLDGEVFEAPIQGISEDGKALLFGAGKARALPIEKLVSIDFPNRPLGTRPSTVRLELLSGERLVGALERSDLLDTLRVAVTGAGTLQVSVDELRRLVIPGNLPPGLGLPPLRKSGDVLHFTAGSRLDSLPGEVVRIEANRVVWATSDGSERSFDFARDRVVAIELEPLEEPRTLEGLHARAAFSGGSIITGRLQAVAKGGLGLKRGEALLALDPAHLLRVDLEGGAFAFLSAEKPTDERFVPYVAGGGTAATLRDRGFDGARRLRIGGQAFERGLGLQAHTRLRYAVPERFRRFRGAIGVASGSARRRVPGSGRVVIRAGGKQLWDSGPMRAGEPPRRIDLDLGEARELEIEVLRVDLLSVGSRIVLGNALLLAAE